MGPEPETRQWDGTADSAYDIIAWILREGGTASYVCSDPARCWKTDGNTPHTIQFTTGEKTTRVHPGGRVTKGAGGEFLSEPAGR